MTKKRNLTRVGLVALAAILSAAFVSGVASGRPALADVGEVALAPAAVPVCNATDVSCVAAELQNVPVLDAAAMVAMSLVFARPPQNPRANVYPLQEKCNSTVFGAPGDVWAGGDAYCLGAPVGPYTVGIAHRFLPCGTPVLIRNARTGRSMVVPVVDHGPYGALLDDGTWVVKKKAGDPGRWRGCADLTPFTALLLGHDGWDRVELSYDRPRRPLL